ncbi:TetR/AcrR family transcriptional regulator [Microbacterium sp. X-17]|uniref:TetR/AcrR family transcriptional regulator n=1 Tax=Microbacterium sp. X-17 TaxID=3144404 RepID=UPI0031F59FBB
MSTARGRRPVTSRMSGDARRVQIREVAAGLFGRAGYRDTSMDRIADEVGIKKASLYYYFPSKDRLLIEMHDEMIELIISSHEARMAAGNASPSELIVGMMTDIVSLQETHPGSLRVFFEHFNEIPEPERTRVLERRGVYEGYLREQLQRGIDAGEFKPLDVRLAVFAILGMANWSYQWFRPGGRATAEQVAREFWTMLSAGIAAT